MPQSLACLFIHLVFSTKHRAPMIRDETRDALHGYLAGTLKKLSCEAALINSVEDHVHVLFQLGRTCALSHVVQELKGSSSKWMKSNNKGLSDFAWQAGYAAFSVSARDWRRAYEYIAKQQEHHQIRTFQDELRDLLRRSGVKFDERYVWD